MGLSNLVQRVIVAMIFIPLIVTTIFVGEIWFVMMLELIILLGLYEFYLLASHKDIRPHRLPAYIVGCIIPPLIYLNKAYALWPLFIALLVVLTIVELLRKPQENSSPINNIAVTLFGVVYVGGLLAFLLCIRELPHTLNIEYRHAGTWLLMMFISIWVCDTAAYFVGRRFGKKKLFERVSPKKTMEGAIGGAVGAITSALVCYLTFVEGLTIVDVIVIGAISGTVGQISDLIESLFKRDAGIKDSSNLIPGHGGILDRFDSVILVAPVVFFYLFVIAFGML